MCVIIAKFKGADFPSKATVKACMQANPEGYAIAWNEDGALRTLRTMSAREALAAYDKVRKLDPEKTAMVFHARIATHGSRRLENCHCWTDDEGQIAFAHNGVLSSVGNRDDMTDSETFLRDIFLPIYEDGLTDVAWRVADVIARANNSRLAFLDGNGQMRTFGNFSKECEAGHRGMVYFSNMAWKDRMTAQWPFDERKAPRTAKPKDNGTFPGVTAKDLLRKPAQVEIPFWSPRGGMFEK